MGIYLALILFICLTPVFLYTKSIRKTFFVGSSMILLLFFYKNFFLGRAGVYHDTFRHSEVMFYIVRQWVKHGFSPGWNPFMNGGEPIYLFSNNIFKVPYLFFSLVGQFIKIDGHTLFNQCWIFIFLTFCIGSFLLFLALFDDFRVAFFCFVALLLSGCFYVNAAQAVGLSLLYFFTYILFGLVIAIKKKSPLGLVFAIICLSLSCNIYVPLYTLLIFFFLVSVIFLFNPQYFKIVCKIVSRHYKLIIFAVFVAVLAAGPLIFLRSELKDFVSPTRGAFTEGGALAIDQEGAQPRVSASFPVYRLLIDRLVDDGYGRKFIHHGFYFGILPLMLIAVALLRSKSRFVKPFFITAIFAAMVGAGKDFFVFPALVKYVPGFSMIRHTFPFAQLVPFLLICVSGFGLKVVLSEGPKLKIALIGLLAGSGLLLVTSDNISRALILSSFAALLFPAALQKILKYPVVVTRFAYLFIFAVLLFDVCFFNINLPSSDIPLKSSSSSYDNMVYPSPPTSYPTERTFYSNPSTSTPFNLCPIYFKKASLTSPGDDLIFMRNARLHDMLRMFKPGQGDEAALGVGMPTAYFTDDARIFDPSIKKDAMIKEIYEDFLVKESKGLRVFFQKNEIDFSLPDENKEKIQLRPEAFMGKNDNPNRMSMEINVPTDGFLVRQENFHKGWRATVDDRPAKVYRANYAFQAIRLPAGKHKVVFEFKTIYPILFWIYISISVLLWIFLNYYLYRLKPECGKTQT